MQANAQLLTEQDVVRLITSLCELLSTVNTGSKNCSSERLIHDSELREKVLRSAARSDDHQLRRIAYKLLRVDFSTVFPQHDKNNAETMGIDSSAENSPTRIVHHHNTAQLKLLKAAVASLSLALVVTIGLLIWNSLEDVFNQQVKISGSIAENTLWTSDKEYILNDVVYVEQGAVLTIEPGTVIRANNGSALLVTRDSQLMAKGNIENPIVFTSNKPVGQRQRGDWGGVVLLGNARINRGESAHIEGIPTTDPRGDFGGTDTSSSCGVLEYARIEFAGYEVYTDNELNGLTLGGCGSNTIIRHVQVHKALDDGIEVFGGNVNMKHIVVTGAKDDSFDWDMGWQGNVQFLVIQQHLDGGDNGFEGDNDKKFPQAKPISRPTFYNVTMLGANNSQISQRAMNIRRGSGGIFGNFIVAGFSKEAVDLRGKNVAERVMKGMLNHNNMLFYAIGKNGKQYFSNETGKDNDDADFIEADYFATPYLDNRFGFDPRLPPNAYNPTEPEFTPYSHSPARNSNAKIPQGEFWDEGADYLGAIRPGIANNWLSGWTSYPSN